MSEVEQGGSTEPEVVSSLDTTAVVSRTLRSSSQTVSSGGCHPAANGDDWGSSEEEELDQAFQELDSTIREVQDLEDSSSVAGFQDAQEVETEEDYHGSRILRGVTV